MLSVSSHTRAPHPAPWHRRVRLAGWLLAAAVFGTSAATRAGTTWYVRADGGNATQCTGRSDAPYPGSGTQQACAWSHPFVALPPGGTPRMAGGDTLLIGSGSYRMGVGAVAGAERCSSGSPWDCYMPPLPSGASADQPTRVLGRGHESGCAAPPELWGTERASMVLNLAGSSNVEVGCLEVTDHSACIEGHHDGGARCQRSTAPFGAWAPTGLYATRSHNVWLHDMDIHGLANQGILAGGLVDWTLERVKIRANGWAGWNGDIGDGSSNSGQILMREVEVAWNGCTENYPAHEIHACWAQQAGGYGDGLGTARTGGDWVIEDSMFHHNTSDGLDLLYADGSGSITVRRVHAEGNAGNQIKVNGPALVENSVVVGNCNYFAGMGSMVPGDHCRALGNAISAGLVKGKQATLRYNSITGEGDCLVIDGGGDATSTLRLQNNALLGRNSVASAGRLTCGHYGENAAVRREFTGNLFFGVRSGQCPPGSLCSDPRFTDPGLQGFDPMPQASSPLVDRADPAITVATDHRGAPRPVGAGPDIGAIEYGSDPGSGQPPEQPGCERRAPQVSIGPTPAPVAAGSTLAYAITVTSRDGSTCPAAHVTLDRSLPDGWTGRLSQSGVDLAPGASTTAQIEVTSASSAQAGAYPFEVEARSNGLAGRVTGTYRVAAPPAEGCRRGVPRLRLGTPSPASGRAGATLVYPVTLTSTDGATCAAATFRLAASLPSGWSGHHDADSLRLAPGASAGTLLRVTSARSAAAGTYPVQAGATGSGMTATATADYIVTGDVTPPAQCTRAAPTVRLGGAGPAVGYGTPVSFSIDVTNRDSRGCAASRFDLAGSLPQDFSGRFADDRLQLAPGAVGHTTITLASPYYTWAAPGGYTFAVSASGNGHRTTAKSSYTVVAPLITIATNKPTYARGETMTLTSRLTSGGKPVVQNTIRVTITRPNGSTLRVSGATNASGVATIRVPLTGSGFPGGSYGLYADGSIGATPVNGRGSFRIR